MDLDTLELADINGIWCAPMQERYEAFAALRRERPIAFMEEAEIPGLGRGPGYWALTRHADVLHVSRHPEQFCSGRGTNIADLPVEMAEFYGSMINMDDPRHARLRRIVSAGFTPRTLAKIEDDIAAVAAELVAGVATSGGCDFVTELSAALPLRVICEMMAIPNEHHDTVLEATNLILSRGDPEYMPENADPIGEFLKAGSVLAELMGEVAERCRDGDGHDLTTALVNAELDDDRLSRADLASFFVLLCAAGTETTRNAMSWALVYLTENPDQRSVWFDAFDEVAPTAVEEIVRMSSPVIHFRRTVTADGVTLPGHDHVFDEGDKVVMYYPAANRDTSVFDAPDQFDVRRAPNPHVGFGGPGPHFCLGAHLARRQITAMYRELSDQLPDIRAAGEPVRLRSDFINGVKHLDCEYTPR